MMTQPRAHGIAGTMAVFTASLLVVLLMCGCTPPPQTLTGVGRPAAPDPGGSDVADIAARALPAVVSIWCELAAPDDEVARERRRQMFEWFKQFAPGDGEEEGGLSIRPGPIGEDIEGVPQGVSVGSGWIYSTDGYIVTNAHVVKDASLIKVRLNDVEGDTRLQTAVLWGTDAKSELAVIKVDVDRRLPILRLGDSDRLQVGAPVIAVGSPFNLPQTVTSGIVSAKGRYLAGESDEIVINDVLQTDAAVNIGNSGGPLLDADGRVIGVNVAIASPRGPVPGNVGIAFAIPADTVSHVVPLLIEQRRVRRGWLGVGIDDLTPNALEFLKAPGGGVLVKSTFPDTPATRAGLRPRDVITAVDRVRIKTTWDLQREIMNREPSSQITLGVIRDGVPIEVIAQLGEMPAKYSGLRDVDAAAALQAGDPGIKLARLDAKLAGELGTARETGVAVIEVDKQSTAWSQVKRGDVVLAVQGTPVQTLTQYEQAMATARKAGCGYAIIELERVDADGRVALHFADVPLR